MRSGVGESERMLVFDCGDLGYSKMAAHGHADSLSILVSAFGQQLIMDPGTYSYLSEPDWRNYFKGTLAHNTISVDKENQSEIIGPFLWGRRAKSAILKWITNDEFDFVAGEHDGYSKGPEPIKHRRKILFAKPHYWLIIDFLLGRGKHVFESCFHFAMDTEVEKKSDGEVLINKNDVFCRFLNLTFDRQGEHRHNAEIEIRSGWVSPKFGVKYSAPIMSYHIEGEAPIVFAHLIYPFKIKSDEFLWQKLLFDEENSTFTGTVAFKNFVDSIEISDDNLVKFKRA